MQSLTPLQQQVLIGLAESKTVKELAAQRHRSVKTVEGTRASIYQKLGFHDLAALTRYAIREGMVKL